MGLSGQRLGKKDRYTYISDDGSKYSLKLDISLATVTGTGLTTTTTADGATPKPGNFKPRVVYIQYNDPENGLARKAIVCNLTGALYKEKTQSKVTIDELEYRTTGRRGETLVY